MTGPKRSATTCPDPPETGADFPPRSRLRDMVPGRRPLHPAGSTATALAIVAANLVPVVGVVALGWSTAAFLGVYLLELAAVAFWTVVKIPFAEKRPNDAIDDRFPLLGPLQAKRGATGLPGPLPPAYLRNVPTLAAALLLGPATVLVGFLAFALTRPEITVAVVQSAFLGGAAVFLVRGVRTWVGYFRGGGYREHSPRSLLLAPFRGLLGVGTLFLVLVLLENATAGDGAVVGGRALLVAVAAGKLTYDLRALQIRRDDDRRGLFAKLYGSERTEVRPVPVETPDGDPGLCIGPSRRAAVADAVLRGLAYGFLRRGILVAPVVALGILADAPAIAVAGLALGLVLSALRATTRYLRYGTLEYRCYDGVVVAHDRLLDEPQARLERHAVTDATVSEGWVDRLCGTETLSLDALGDDDSSVGLFVPEPDEIDSDDANENRPMQVVHVEDAAAVADALGVSWHLERDGSA